MGLFGRKAATAELLPAARAARDTVRRERELEAELVSQGELNGAISLAISQAIRKALNYDQFIAFDNADDQGGYYGTEFDIRSTAGRLKGLYSREPWIYATATKIAKSLSTVPLKVRNPKTKVVIEDHPLQALLDMGAPNQSQKELRWTRIIDLVLGGNYFIILEQNFKKIAGLAPVELVNLVFDPARIKVIAIEVQVSGAAQTQAKRFPIEQIIWPKLPNPYSPFYGLSPFCAAARPILLDRMKSEFEMAFYLRGATSNGVIETTEDLSKSRFKRLMHSFEQAFTGKANWWRTLFLPKGSTWKNASLSMKDAEHLEGLKDNRKTILATIGIPPSEVGLVEDVNYANSQQQKQTYWNDTVVPFAEFEASGWNQSYLVKEVYKGKVEVFADFSSIEAVQGFVSTKKEKADAMATTHWIDEIREKVWGDKPLPNGAGARFIAEVRGASAPPAAGALAAPAAPGLPPSPTKAVIPDGYEVHTLVFAKDIYKSAADARAWAKDNGYPTEPCEEVDGAWRIRTNDLDLYENDGQMDVPLTDGVVGICGKRKAEAAKAFRLLVKASATSSQNRAEDRLAKGMATAVELYVDELVLEAATALRQRRDVRKALAATAAHRQTVFFEKAKPVYDAALERGFSAANANVKDLREGISTKRARFTGLTETDQQAVDVLRERGRDGRRRVLEQRSISAFRGFDATRTDAILGLVEAGEKQGLSLEKIAENLRSNYDEAYRNQARTIVRTEILSAYSAGLAWNFDVLGEVFSEVEKEWMHQGDDGINAHARPEHVELDGVTVGRGESFEVVDPSSGERVLLDYPRDPKAPAGQIINCRCTMGSVIPDGAISNAEAILETT